MAARSRLRFDPFELAYMDTYGIGWDYNIDRLVASGMSHGEAWKVVEGRMKAVYDRMKYEHEHAEEIARKKLEEELERECPFT